jgi:hypothetical protein
MGFINHLITGGAHIVGDFRPQKAFGSTRVGMSKKNWLQIPSNWDMRKPPCNDLHVFIHGWWFQT